MDKYIFEGVEYTFDQIAAMAFEAGMATADFMAAKGITKALAEDVEEDFQEGVAEEDAAVAPAQSRASELESRLADISSELQDLRGSIGPKDLFQSEGKKRYRQLEAESKKTRDELVNHYDSLPLDINIPETLVNKGQTDIKEFLEQNYNWLTAEESGIGFGNAVTVYLPDGPQLLDLQPFTDAGYREAIDLIKKIKQEDERLTNSEKLGKAATKFIDHIKNNRDTTVANQLLENTGYKIVQNSEKSSTPGQYMSQSSTSYDYTLLKDGQVVLDNTKLSDIDNYLETNFNEQDYEALDQKSYEATSSFLEDERKRLEKEREVFEEDKSVDIKYFVNNFENDLVELLEIEGTQAAEDLSRYFLNKKSQRRAETKLAARNSLGREKLRTQQEYLKDLSSLSDLPESVLSAIQSKYINNQAFEKDVKANLDLFKNKEFSQVANTASERLMEESGNQDLLRLAQTYSREQKEQFNQGVKDRVELTSNIYDEKFNATLTEQGKKVVENAPEGTELSITYLNGKPIFKLTNDRDLSDEEFKQFKKAELQMFKLQTDFSNLQFDFNATLQNIQNDVAEFYADSAVNQDVYNLAIKEYGLGALMAKDINDAFASVLLAVPTLLDADWAINQQRILNDKNKYYETMTSYNDGDFGTYFFRTLSQQSANIVLAIGTAGTGSALGLSTAMTQAAIGTTFGLSSGTQTFRDLSVQKDLVVVAKEQERIAKQAFENGDIDEFTFNSVMKDINQTIAMNDLSDSQIIDAATANGLIEGVFTSIIGTAPNTVKLLKDFRGQGNLTQIIQGVNQNSTAQIANMIGKPLSLRLGGEIAEEEIIYFGQQYVTEYGILDRDLDLSQWDDTAMATIVTAGTSQAPGVAYSSLLTYGLTNDVKKRLNSVRTNQLGLSKLISRTKDEKIKKILFNDMTNDLEQLGLEVDRLSIDILNVGAEDVKTLILASQIMQDFDAQAGVTPNMTPAQREKAINSYENLLTGKEKQQYRDSKQAVQTQINNIHNKIDKTGDYKKAQESLGDIYVTYNARFKKSNEDSYNTKSPVDKLVQIVKAVRADLEAENLAKAKANPAVVEAVENRLSESGTPLTETQKEALYLDYGKNVALTESRGLANKLNIDRSINQILGEDSNVKVVQINSKEELDEAMNNQKVAASQRPKFEDMPYGFVVGNTIYTQNEKQTREDLEDGQLRAGTVVYHELNHVIDNNRMTDEGREKYADNLFAAAGTSSNLIIRREHNRVLQQLIQIYGTPVKLGEQGFSWSSASREFKDEYTKYLQEQLYAFEDEAQIEKDENSLVRTFNELFRDANNLNTPARALNYMAANNAAFRSGKLSRKSRRAIENAKPETLQASEKTVNELAAKYKKGDLTAEETLDFFNQYRNTALAAMGYDVRAGDIPTDKALGFATDAFERVTRTYKPEDGSFTNWIYSTIGREGRAKIGEELERKKSTSRISDAQEQTRLISDDTAESNIELQERADKEDARRKQLIDPRKMPLVAPKIREIETVVDIQPTKITTATFKDISDDFAAKIASIIYEVDEGKLGKDAKNLTYADQIIDPNTGKKAAKGIIQKSQLGQLQQDFKTVDATRRAVKLMPIYNIVTPTAIISEQGESIPVSRNVAGTSLGISNKVLDFFYEDYVDPRALSKDPEVRKQAITNKSGRSKGLTTQTPVKRLKPEFMGTLSNETIKRIQNDFAEINRDFSQIKDSKARLKAIRDVGQRLKGYANLVGGIVGNTIADKKIDKIDIKTAKPKRQIKADVRGGRSPVQFSKKPGPVFLDPSNTYFDKFGMMDLVVSQTFPEVANSDEVKSGRKTLFEALTGDQRIKVVEKLIGAAPVQFSKKALSVFVQPEFKLAIKDVDGVLESNNVKGIYKFNTEEDVDTYVAEVKKRLLPLMPKDFWFGKPDKNGNYGTEFTPGKITGMSKDVYRYYKAEMEKLALDSDQKYGKPVLIDGVATDFKKTSYDSLFKTKAIILKKIESGEIEAFNEKVSAIHSAMWSRFNAAINKDKENARVIGNYLKIVGTARTHWHKLGAQFVGYSNKITGERFEYEHAMPATAAYLYLLDISLAGVNFDTAYELVMSNYKLISLDKAMDNKLTSVGLRRNMPIGWNLLDNRWIDRYFNEAVSKVNGGIDPAGIIGLDGRNFQEIYNVNVDGSVNSNTFKADSKEVLEFGNTADEAMSSARESINYSKKIKKARVFDFDDTLARSKSMVIVTMPDGSTRKINATQFATQALTLEEQGATFDFTEFSKVIDGKRGPLFNVAKKIQDARGSEDIFILTARPANSAIAIQKFLSGLGLNIPLKNITGLGDGKPQAKADWFVEKYAEGFNDFYFADDAIKNVKAVKDVFDVLDVKSRVQQARVQFSKKLSKDFNDMIERGKGVKSEAKFSEIQARRRGKKQKKYSFFIPPSADDFRGLTMYTFAGRGKQGEADQEFFDKALIKPYQRGISAMEQARTKVRMDYRALLSNNKDIRKRLNKKVADTKFTLDQAIRVYLWNKAGYEIPGLSKRDQATLTSFVMSEDALIEFANGVQIVTRQKNMYEPTEYWDGSTILGDLNNIVRVVNREQFLKEFIENVDTIFSETNLNKVQALYGFRVREALEEMIFRMKTGTNAKKGAGRIVNAWNNWVNNSVGAIMFFNRRSALLQTISTVNFVNWSDNNPIKAGIAFANQPQYWSDFNTLWNSPKLVARRRGLESDLQEAEIAKAAKEGGAQGVISYLLKIGFTPTQLADSFAIASGGATFYRNRINTYKKQGMTIEDAEKKAFEDFSSIADETQQSADPMLISSQQASILGRLVLAFQNTPMQYTRLMKKAGQDLINNRGSKTENISKILYYGFVQNLIFSTLQNAMFALLPGFDDEEEDFKTDEEREEYFEKEQYREEQKITRTLNSMLDTLLRGSGLAGAVVSTIKNVILEYQKYENKNQFAKENADILLAVTSISPPINYKLRQINNALQTKEFEKDVIAERGFDVTIDGKFILSPSYDIIADIASVANIPLNRAIDELNAISEALDNRNTMYQRIALAAGWRQWDVGAQNEEHDLIKTTATEKRKKEGIEKAKETRRKNRELKLIKINKIFDIYENLSKEGKQKVDSILNKTNEGLRDIPLYKIEEIAKEDEPSRQEEVSMQ